MLRLLERLDYWPYEFRTCATLDELKLRLTNEWRSLPRWSVLYFNTHGSRDKIWLTDDTVESEHAVGSLTLQDWVAPAENCHIHFGGCHTFEGSDYNLKTFLKETKARSVSGYATEVGFLNMDSPGILVELMLFAELSEIHAPNTGDKFGRLEQLKKDINRRFPECKFDVLMRE